MIDFFAKAMGEIKETKLSEIPEMPKFFEDLPESQEDKDSPVATVNPIGYAEDDLRSNPLTLTEASEYAKANNTLTLSEVTYKTDDNGNIYCIDGKLQPNTSYELNGNVYTTDANGRIVSCEAWPARTPENPRDLEAQRQAGGDYRRPNDQGGHIVGRDMSGDGGIGNLVAMDSKINQSDYKRMENNIKTALDEGKDVATKTELTYSGDSERPDRITVTVSAEGEDTVYKFDNNLDGALGNEVPASGKETVLSRLDETGGEISSIKEEYNKAGSLDETTVYITYKGEDGTNYRTSVVIESQ